VFKFKVDPSIIAPVLPAPIFSEEQQRLNDILERAGRGPVRGAPAPAPAPAPTPWVKHKIPKDRWTVISCNNGSAPPRYPNNCEGADPYGLDVARANTERLLRNGVTGGFAVYIAAVPTSRAGAVHTQFNASNYQQASGVDVYELRIDPACRYEHWWQSVNGKTTVDNASPARGEIRATAYWKADQCISARSTVFGATLDEDYACMVGYYNTVTNAECPPGVTP
jgi:hypothetical protein